MSEVRFIMTVTSKYSVGDVFMDVETEYYTKETKVDGETFTKRSSRTINCYYTITGFDSVTISPTEGLGINGDVYLYICNLKKYLDNNLRIDVPTIMSVKQLNACIKMETKK